jgi:hypothetical protein
VRRRLSSSSNNVSNMRLDGAMGIPLQVQVSKFCLFVRTSSIHFALLKRKRKYKKSKTTAKLIEKRTSIAAV